MKIVFFIMVFTVLGFSVPAYKGDIEFKQEDGSKFIGKLKGDEWFSWVEDKQKNIIKYNKESKNYEYAKVIEKDGKLELVASNSKVSPNRTSPFQVKKEDLSKIWKEKKEKAMRRLPNKRVPKIK